MPAVLLAVLLICLGPDTAQGQTPAAQAGAIEGVVSTQSGSVRLPGALVTVLDQKGTEVTNTLSGGDGTFTVPGLVPGQYRVSAALDAFKTAEAPVTVVSGKTVSLALDLAIAEVAEHVDVVASPVAAARETVGSTETVTNSESEDYSPGGGLHAALRLLASVIQVPGGLSIKGGRPDQAGAQLGASTLIDPSSGLVDLALPADAIDSVSVMPNPYAVEFGRFSSGLVVIQTKRGGDSWHMRLNDLDPNFRTVRGEDFKIDGLREFAPRLEVGGPLVPGKLFLEQAAQYRYLASEVSSRPQDELRVDEWFSSFTRVDANLSPRQSLIATGGFYPGVTDDATLGTFTPPAATVNRHESIGHAAMTERGVWTDGLLSEITARVQQYGARIEPQGSAVMELRPETTFGNFFNTQSRTTSTAQVIGTLSTSHKGPGGLHLWKFGVDLLHSEYDGSSTSGPVLIETTTGTLVRRLEFTGPTRQQVQSTDVALFAQDRLQPSARWYVEFGGRVDRDGVLDRVNVTPRVGTAVLLDEGGNAVIRGGYGLFYERTPSAAGAFGQFENTIDTRYASDGATLVGPPTEFVHVTAPNLATARSATWNVAFEQRINATWSYHAGLLDRRGSNELVVRPEVGAAGAQLVLSSDGQSEYRDAEFGVHFTRASGLDVNATYVRSLARSNTNGFSNYFGAVLEPVIGEDAYAATAADAPNRLLVRGRLLTGKWLFAGIADWRTGFPYSVVDAALDFVGPRNVSRFPDQFHLELGAERKIKVLKWEPWIGVRVNNPFNTFNPMDIQANISSPYFGSLYNPEIRKFNLIIRFAK